MPRRDIGFTGAVCLVLTQACSTWELLGCCGFVMGHGNHWRCIFPDLENDIADALGWVPQGTVIGQREYTTL